MTNDLIKNQMMYLAARELLKKLVKSETVSLEFAERLNRKNAETLMCDSLSLGEIAH